MIAEAFTNTQPSTVDICDLLRKQLAEWKELNRVLSDQNLKEPNHKRFNDIQFCQDMIECFETELLQNSYHL